MNKLKELLLDKRLNATEIAARTRQHNDRHTASTVFNRQLRTAPPLPASAVHEVTEFARVLTTALALNTSQALLDLTQDKRLTKQAVALAMAPQGATKRTADWLLRQRVETKAINADEFSRLRAYLRALLNDLRAALASEQPA